MSNNRSKIRAYVNAIYCTMVLVDTFVLGVRDGRDFECCCDHHQSATKVTGGLTTAGHTGRESKRGLSCSGEPLFVARSLDDFVSVAEPGTRFHHPLLVP
jgi:hypothetical protein